MHEVTLKGLDPETEYFYKCGEWTNGFSDTFSFKTQSDNGNAPVYFSAIGDQGPDFGGRGERLELRPPEADRRSSSR